MPVFKNRENKKDAIWLSEDRHSDEAIEIKEPEDLRPMLEVWRQVNIDPWFIDEGVKTLDSFLRAFLKKPKVYYVWIFNSAFKEPANAKTT